MAAGLGVGTAIANDEADDAARQVAGVSLGEWRIRMKSLNFSDPASAEYVPGLIELVTTTDIPWYTRRQAALTLGRMGDSARAAVPVLVALVNAPPGVDRTETRLWAVKALGLFGPVASDAAPTLIETFDGEGTSFLTQLSIVDTVSQIGPEHPASIPFLIRVAAGASSRRAATADIEREQLRQAAVEALGMQGPTAGLAIPVLVRTLDADDESLRREAATALGRIGPAAEVAATNLLDRLLLDEDAAVRDQAATALQQIGPVVGPRLRPLLHSEDATVRQRVIRIFGAWSSQGRPWLDVVRECWDDADARVRVEALEAAWKISTPAEAVAPRLVREFVAEDRQVRRRAFLVFSQLGLDEEATRLLVAPLLSDPRPEIQTIAHKALEASTGDDVD